VHLKNFALKFRTILGGYFLPQSV